MTILLNKTLITYSIHERFAYEFLPMTKVQKCALKKKKQQVMYILACLKPLILNYLYC